MIILGYNEITENLPGKIVDINVPSGDKFIKGEPTDRDILKKIDIEHEDLVIIYLRNDEKNVLATLIVRDLNDRVKIAAIVEKAETVDKIYGAGADYVILESELLAKEIIRHLFIPQVANFMDRVILSDDLEILAIMAPKQYWGRKIQDTDIRERIGLIVAIKRDGKIIQSPQPQETIKGGDILLFLIKRKEINKIREMMGQWLLRKS